MDRINTEFSDKLAALERRVEALEREVALLKGEAPAPAAPDGPEEIDLSLDDFEVVAAPAEAAPEAPVEVIPEEKPAAEAPAAPVEVVERAEASVEERPEVIQAPAAEAPVAETPSAEAPVEDLPAGLFGDPEPGAPKEKPGQRAKKRRVLGDVESGGKVVMDVMADKAAWLHDIPGPEVKSLRSAIGLGDQVVFIRRLFRDDSALYVATIEKLNATATLKEAVDYLGDTFPEWDISSDDVYRFMMAVRRKIRH